MIQINWKELNTEANLPEIIAQSFSGPCLIFKHSTRCSISKTALSRLERTWHQIPEPPTAYYLDLLQNRVASNAVAEQFSVQHESPQVLLIHNGGCSYHASHSQINAADLAEQLQNLLEVKQQLN